MAFSDTVVFVKIVEAKRILSANSSAASSLNAFDMYRMV